MRQAQLARLDVVLGAVGADRGDRHLHVGVGAVGLDPQVGVALAGEDGVLRERLGQVAEALPLGRLLPVEVPRRVEQRVVAVVVGEERVAARLRVVGEDVGASLGRGLVDEGPVGVEVPGDRGRLGGGHSSKVASKRDTGAPATSLPAPLSNRTRTLGSAS